jgi:hypothetical protein
MHFLGRQLFPDSKKDRRGLRQLGSVRIDLKTLEVNAW